MNAEGVAVERLKNAPPPPQIILVYKHLVG